MMAIQMEVGDRDDTDDQHRNPNMNNKDHIVWQLTRRTGERHCLRSPGKSARQSFSKLQVFIIVNQPTHFEPSVMRSGM